MGTLYFAQSIQAIPRKTACKFSNVVITNKLVITGLGTGRTGMKKTPLARVWAVAIAVLLTMALVSPRDSRAQTQQQSPAQLDFDIASIKPNKSMSGDSSLNTPGGGLSAVNVSLKVLMEFAYNVRDDQLSGGPAWLDTEHYDIVAKAPASTQPSSKGDPSDDTVRRRVQALLTERFRLAVHHESKEMPTLALVQDKAGAKLTPWKEGDPPGPHMHLESTRLVCRKQSMQRFASMILPGILGRPVVDKTGLTGEYNFTMTFEPESSAGTAPETPTGPTFVEALSDQLGLKLERQKLPVDFLVIDHAEKPDPN